MDAKIVKWGNGQGIRFPKSIMNALSLKLGDAVRLSVDHDRLIIEKVFRHQSLEERALSSGGALLSFESFDWGEPEGEELW